MCLGVATAIVVLNDFRQKRLEEILPYISRRIEMARCTRTVSERN